MLIERPIGFEHEKRDCTVRSLSMVTDIPYKDVHAAFKRRGRKDKHRINLDKVMKKVCKILRVKKRLVKSRGTVKSLIKLYPKGKLCCTVRGHAFPIIDGIPHDLRSVNQYIKHAWLITK